MKTTTRPQVLDLGPRRFFGCNNEPPGEQQHARAGLARASQSKVLALSSGSPKR